MYNLTFHCSGQQDIHAYKVAPPEVERLKQRLERAERTNHNIKVVTNQIIQYPPIETRYRMAWWLFLIPVVLIGLILVAILSRY